MSLLIAFLIGAIPSGYIIGLLHGKDIRNEGSGNIGATNVNRLLGKKAGILTLLLDIFKGIIAIEITKNFSAHDNSTFNGLAAIFGHCFSPFLKFKGGKGVATSLGVFLYLASTQAIIIIFVFISALICTNFVSLSSILAALALPLAIFLAQGTSEIFLSALIASMLVIYKHSANIQRLIKGEESKFRKKNS